MAAQFKVAPADPAFVSLIQEEFGLPRFVARTMVAHGVASLEEAHRFLSPDIERDWHNPYEIDQMEAAADRLEAAVREGERILVFGDFDLDGISATTVLTRGLRALGGNATPFIPKRFDEGYGLTPAAISRAKAYDPQLIVTVDCGISCKEEARAIVAQGIDLVVTDHHEPGSMVPEGVVVTDPKCNPSCPSAILAGVGVALKLVQALGARFGMPHLWRDYTDFATLGTVADLMPLTGENRALVADGIARMNSNPRPCIAALVGVCNVAGKPLSSTNLSFSLIPRLNAAGRMGNADLALDLLMADDFEEAQAKASALDQVNDERRAIEAELAEQAKEKAAALYHGQRALVVAGEGWHEGVKGIVASRLVNAYGVPALLFTVDGDEARGSGRSVGSVNLFKAVESTSDILTRFGGHEAAVGVTLPADKLPEFADRLCAYMDTLPEDDFHPLVEVDALIDLNELTLDSVAELDRLAPFGQENLTPRYLARNVRLVNCRAVGAGKNHLSCALTDGVATVDAIMFHCDGIGNLMACGSVVNAAFQVQIDEWRGRRTVKCMLDVVEPTSSCPALDASLPADDMAFMDALYKKEGAVGEGNQSAEAHAAQAAGSSATTPCGCAVSEEGPRTTRVFGSCCPPAASETPAPRSRTACREHWRDMAQGNADAFTTALTQELLGEGSLHEAQARALAALAAGRNTLAVMGTGRGKSLIFQVHAARVALSQGKASLFVYPLRALIADQRFHIASLFSHFGLTAACLTGETPVEERERTYAALSEGLVDVVLTTPEYLAYHAARIAASGRIGFVAVDEAHHMVQSGAGKRTAYASLGGIIASLGNPVVLAVTATAPAEVREAVCAALNITDFVSDANVRQNLRLDDRRSLRDKDSYVASIVASGEKTIVYVNSRVGTVDVARTMRSMVPHMAMQIGFYNAGLSRAERERIEHLFRTNVLRVLVCTSAFGEGVNIPDVRHVVLYGMPFSEVEFNQMSGRAGRNGSAACIHMLFGKRDASDNQGILEQSAPPHDTMAQMYRELKRLQKEASSGSVKGASAGAAGSISATSPDMVHDGDVFFTISNEELAATCTQRAPHFGVSADACACGISVFEELGLARTRHVTRGGVRMRAVHVCDFGGKVELSDSVLYREGLGDTDAFGRFADWVMGSTAEALRNKIIRPILPDDDRGEGERHA